MKRIALFPGSFDPITLGHLEIIQRGANLFDEVVVGIFTNTTKAAFFSNEERLRLVEEATKAIPNVKVVACSGKLTVDFAEEIGAKFLIRGLRSVKDFEYEREIALMNRHLAPTIETVLLYADEKYDFISSSLLKEIVHFQGDVAEFLPACVLEALKNRSKVGKSS